MSEVSRVGYFFPHLSNDSPLLFQQPLAISSLKETKQRIQCIVQQVLEEIYKTGRTYRTGILIPTFDLSLKHLRLIGYKVTTEFTGKYSNIFRKIFNYLERETKLKNKKINLNYRFLLEELSHIENKENCYMIMELIKRDLEKKRFLRKSISCWLTQHDINRPKIQSVLTKLAKQQLIVCPTEFSAYIQNYQIQSEERRIKIAIRRANQNGYDVSRYIQNYAIQNQNALVEIFKIAAQQNAYGASEFVQNYQIQSEQVRKELADFVIDYLEWEIAYTIDNYQLNTEMVRFEVFWKSFIESPSETILYSSHYHFYPSSNFQLNQLGKILYFLSRQESETLNFVKNLILEQAQSWYLDVSPLLRLISYRIDTVEQKMTINPIFIQWQGLEWLECIFIFLFRSKNSRFILQNKQVNSFFIEALKRCYAIHQPTMRFFFSVISIKVFIEQYGLEFYRELHQKHPQSPFCLLHVLMTWLERRRMSKQFIKTTLSSLYSLKREIKHYEFRGALYRLGLICILNLNLSPKDLEKIWNQAGINQRDGKAQIIERLNLLYAIHELGYEKNHKEKILEIKTDLKSYFLELFQKMLPITPREDFIQRYLKTFGSCRDPTAICLYAASLQHLVPKDYQLAIRALAKFVDCVLEGEDSLREYRLKEAVNPHLHEIFSADPDLRLKWSLCLDCSFKGTTTKGLEYELIETDNPYDLLLSTTEIPGSCLKVHGSALNNRGLLSYLLDGKNKLLAVKMASGKILARTFLKLLLDKENLKPVLFLTSVYPLNTCKEFQQQLISLAKKRAFQLGLPLLSYYIKEESVRYPNSLQSLQGSAPFEYLDEVGGIVYDGIYEIKTAYWLYDPMAPNSSLL